MIVQIKYLGESGSGGQLFVPGAIRALGADQVFDAFVYALTGGVAAGKQTEDGPGSLGGSALGGGKHAIVIAGAALAPSAIGVLNGAQPLAGSQDVDFAIVFAGGAQPAQCEA